MLLLPRDDRPILEFVLILRELLDHRLLASNLLSSIAELLFL